MHAIPGEQRVRVPVSDFLHVLRVEHLEDFVDVLRAAFGLRHAADLAVIRPVLLACRAAHFRLRKAVSPGFEPGLWDSESHVLTNYTMKPWPRGDL